MEQVLFSEGSLSDIFSNIKRKLIDEISKIPESELAQNDDEAISRRFIAEYTLYPPVLHIGRKTQDVRETEFSLKDLYSHSRFYDESSRIRGQIIRIYVPFDGNSDLFRYRGSTLVLSGNKAEIRGSELVLFYQSWANHDLDRSVIDRHLNEISTNLNSVKSDIDKYHKELERIIPNAVAERRKKVQKDREKIEKLGIPARTTSQFQAQIAPEAKAINREMKIHKKGKTKADSRDVFLAHAGADKDKYVRPFCIALDGAGISYWLDEAEIKWGDDITTKINEGMRISSYVIVFISKSFLGRKWPEKEMSAALSRENNLGKTILLPLFIATAKVILNEYPLLAGKNYLEWKKGIAYIITALLDRLSS